MSDADVMTFDTDVRLAILHEFLDGAGTPTVASVANTLRADRSATAAAFERLATSRAIVLVPGTHDIRMSAPFAGAPTDFSVRVGDRPYNANCIWDAAGVLAMLAGAGKFTDADVTTICADCGDALTLRIRGDAITADPPGAVVHFAVPAAQWWVDIGFT